jgi:hypothetical protein
MTTGSIRKDLCLREHEYYDFKQLDSCESNKTLWIYKNNICQLKGLYNHLSYFFSARTHKEKLQKRINHLIKAIDRNPQDTLGIYKSEIRELFFKKLAFLDPQTFNREKISPGSALEALLCPALSKEKEKTWQHAVLEAQFAIKLGLRPQLASSGTTGTYFLMNRMGKKIGVFKPVNGGTGGDDNPRYLRKIYQLFHYTGINPKEIDLAESAASALDRFLRLGIVPKTNRTILKNLNSKKDQIGSFQLFKKGREASKVFHFSFLFRLLPRTVLRWILYLPYIRGEVEKRTPKSFEKLALLDLLIFNYDRNFGNWLIHEKEDKKSVWAIDNGGTSFPTHHPILYVNFLKWYFDRRHRYYWEIIPAAGKPFSHKLEQLILKLNAEELADILRPQLVDWSRPRTIKSFDKKMKCLKERVHDLQKSVRKKMTIRQIALRNFYV